MRKQLWTCAGEHPVPSWLGGDGKTCVGIFCAGARSRSDKSWCGSGNVGAFPAGLVVQRHSRRAGAGSAPGPQPGVAMSPGTFSTATGQHWDSHGYWVRRRLSRELPPCPQGKPRPDTARALRLPTLPGREVLSHAAGAGGGHGGSASPTGVPAVTSL